MKRISVRVLAVLVAASASNVISAAPSLADPPGISAGQLTPFTSAQGRNDALGSGLAGGLNGTPLLPNGRFGGHLSFPGGVGSPSSGNLPNAETINITGIGSNVETHLMNLPAGLNRIDSQDMRSGLQNLGGNINHDSPRGYGLKDLMRTTGSMCSKVQVNGSDIGRVEGNHDERIGSPLDAGLTIGGDTAHKVQMPDFQLHTDADSENVGSANGGIWRAGKVQMQDFQFLSAIYGDVLGRGVNGHQVGVVLEHPVAGRGSDSQPGSHLIDSWYQTYLNRDGGDKGNARFFYQQLIDSGSNGASSGILQTLYLAYLDRDVDAHQGELIQNFLYGANQHVDLHLVNWLYSELLHR